MIWKAAGSFGGSVDVIYLLGVQGFCVSGQETVMIMKCLRGASEICG